MVQGLSRASYPWCCLAAIPHLRWAVSWAMPCTGAHSVRVGAGVGLQAQAVTGHWVLLAGSLHLSFALCKLGDDTPQVGKQTVGCPTPGLAFQK